MYSLRNKIYKPLDSTFPLTDFDPQEIMWMKPFITSAVFNNKNKVSSPDTVNSPNTCC